MAKNSKKSKKTTSRKIYPSDENKWKIGFSVPIKDWKILFQFLYLIQKDSEVQSQVNNNHGKVSFAIRKALQLYNKQNLHKLIEEEYRDFMIDLLKKRDKKENRRKASIKNES